jgi:hypothetical protein
MRDHAPARENEALFGLREERDGEAGLSIRHVPRGVTAMVRPSDVHLNPLPVTNQILSRPYVRCGERRQAAASPDMPEFPSSSN